MKDHVLKKIDNKSIHIGVIGMGYVGLPLALSFAESGYRVTGFDKDINKTDSLVNLRKSYISHISDDRIRNSIESKKFDATADLSKISKTDIIIICLPTPLNKYREPDLSYVTDTMDEMLPYLKEGQMLSLESTTYPGTTEEELRTRIESRGFTVGKDFFLIYSPEREDPGNPNFTTSTIPKVVGGSTEKCLELGLALYGCIISSVIPVSSTGAAELTKLLENIYRAVNIGLVNEMKIVADKVV